MDAPVPKVGDKIYVPTSLYVYHGRDDVQGGLATVTKVEPGISGGRQVHYVAVKEHPGHNYNWEGYLGPDQEKLKARFAGQVAHEDPDDRPEFNDDEADWKPA